MLRFNKISLLFIPESEISPIKWLTFEANAIKSSFIKLLSTSYTNAKFDIIAIMLLFTQSGLNSFVEVSKILCTICLLFFNI